MQVTVELRPHIGVQMTPLGPAEVEHDQYVVMASTPFSGKPIQMGYIGKKPGSPFNGIHTFRKLSEDQKAAIVSQIESMRGEEGLRVFEPPPPPDEPSNIYTGE